MLPPDVTADNFKYVYRVLAYLQYPVRRKNKKLTKEFVVSQFKLCIYHIHACVYEV